MRPGVHAIRCALAALPPLIVACCPEPAPRGDCAGVVARIEGVDWEQAPGLAWAVDGTDVATLSCETLPTASGQREPCEVGFALDDVEPRAEVIKQAPGYVLFSFVGLNDWSQLPETATVSLDWSGGTVDVHEIELADEDAVEEGNQCPQRCRTGQLDVPAEEGGG